MGGKSSKVAPEAPVDMITQTDIGAENTSASTFDQDTAKKEKTIAKKKMGTRGLQIPLAADTTTTPDQVAADETKKTTSGGAAGTGVQI